MNKVKLFLRDLYTRTRRAVLRFPVSMVSILAIFVLLLISVWGDYGSYLDTVRHLGTTLMVTLPLFTAPALVFKNRLALLPGLALGLILYFATDDALTTQDMTLVGLWGLSFYTLMFVLPRWKRDENVGFWKYCEEILFVLILGFICSGILAISLELAIESIRTLFQIDIDYRWNDTMAVFSFAFVLPVFVHVGLPEQWESLSSRHDFPNFFKAISFYLLTPIALLYFGILGAYLMKILITEEWPSGQVAYPIVYLSMVVYGLYLLSYPWRQQWQRWFFFALMPFLVVYFVALGMRIGQYSLTEARYMGILLGVSLALMTVYFAFVKQQRLQMMLLPFTVLAFLFAFGPWGVYELPIRSQEARLENMLTELGALKDGKLQVVSGVDDETVIQISSIVDYLYWRDRLSDLQGWSSSDLSSGALTEDAFMSEMGLTFNPYNYYDPYMGQYFYYNAAYLSTYEVAGFDQASRFDLSYDVRYEPDSTQTFDYADGHLVTMSLNNGLVTLDDGKNKIELNLADLITQLDSAEADAYGTYTPAQLMLEGQSRTMDVRVYFETLNGNYENDQTVRDVYGNGTLLVNFKP